MTPLSELGVAKSALRALAEVGIFTAEDASIQTDEYLLSIKGVGQSTVDKIREWEEVQPLEDPTEDQFVEVIGPSPVSMAYELMMAMVSKHGKLAEDYATDSVKMVRKLLIELTKKGV